MTKRVVILGGGLGALRTAQALRDEDFDGDLTILSAESVLPYDRPPLSKTFLLGRFEEQQLLLATADELADQRIEVVLNARIVGLDLGQRRVLTEDGEEYGYDALVVATGARPNRLAMFEGMENVVYLRDLRDARTLRDGLAGRPRLGVVGGGFIGLEIAAVARELGCEATVIEATAAPLAPILGAELGGWVQTWHERHGVRFVCGSMLTGVKGAGRPEQLIVEDDRTVEVDLVVVGVGVTPELGWLRSAGIEVHRGLVCDADGRTSDPHVVGVGDVTCRHRGERCSPSGHWTATNEHARAAADALLGRPPATRPLQEGYFWSDQYSCRLQFAGRTLPSPRISLESGAMEDEKFLAKLHDGDDEVSAVFAMNSAREFVRSSLALRATPVDSALPAG